MVIIGIICIIIIYIYIYINVSVPGFGPSELRRLILAPTTLQQRSRTLQLQLPGHRNAPATLPDAATTASWPQQRSCNAAGRCNCCFLATATLLHRYQVRCNAPDPAPATFLDTATLLHNSRTLQLLLPGHCWYPGQ